MQFPATAFHRVTRAATLPHANITRENKRCYVDGATPRVPSPYHRCWRQRPRYVMLDAPVAVCRANVFFPRAAAPLRLLSPPRRLRRDAPFCRCFHRTTQTSDKSISPYEADETLTAIFI